MRTGRQCNRRYGVGAACRHLDYQKLAGSVLGHLVQHSLEPRWAGSTGLGLLRLTGTWVTSSLMYSALLVRICMGACPDLCFGDRGALLLGTCPHTARAACSEWNWLENGHYDLGLACRIVEQRRIYPQHCRYLGN